MISEENFRHGYIISQVVSELCLIEGVSVRVNNSLTRSGYRVSVFLDKKTVGEFGLYVKSSSKRRSPWRYTFTRDHQTDIDFLYQEHTQVFTLFINRDDGVACLSHQLLKELLDDVHEETEWVSVASRVGSRYSLKGKDGELDKKISRNDFPRSIGLYVEALIGDQTLKINTKSEESILDRLFGR